MFCLRFLARARAAPRPAVSIGGAGASYGILARADRKRSPRGSAFHFLPSFPRAREGGASASGFDLAAPAPARGIFGASRSKPLAEGCPAFHFLASFPRAREGGASASGFDLAAPARAMGTLRREPIETAGRGVAVACVRSGISGWRDRAPDPWACGRQGGARRNQDNGCCPKARPPPFFCLGFEVGAPSAPARGRTWEGVSATAAGNSWPEGKPSDGLALCWRLASAARDRSLNLHLKGAAFHLLASFPRAREGGASASGFDLGAARAMGTLRREPIETAGRGVSVACVRSGISGWVIVLLIRGRAGAKAARG